MSGLCQPDYMLDIPGGHGKTPVGPNYLSTGKFFFARNVNRTRKRAIVCRTIAATFISILRSHDRPMTDGGGAAPEPPDDQGNRNVENAVMLGFLVVLVAAGIWLLGTMADVRKVQDCAAQGRRNCATIEVPDRAR